MAIFVENEKISYNHVSGSYSRPTAGFFQKQDSVEISEGEQKSQATSGTVSNAVWVWLSIFVCIFES